MRLLIFCFGERSGSYPMVFNRVMVLIRIGGFTVYSSLVNGIYFNVRVTVWYFGKVSKLSMVVSLDGYFNRIYSYLTGIMTNCNTVLIMTTRIKITFTKLFCSNCWIVSTNQNSSQRTDNTDTQLDRVTKTHHYSNSNPNTTLARKNIEVFRL